MKKKIRKYIFSKIFLIHTRAYVQKHGNIQGPRKKKLFRLLDFFIPFTLKS